MGVMRLEFWSVACAMAVLLCGMEAIVCAEPVEFGRPTGGSERPAQRAGASSGAGSVEPGGESMANDEESLELLQASVFKPVRTSMAASIEAEAERSPPGVGLECLNPDVGK